MLKRLLILVMAGLTLSACGGGGGGSGPLDGDDQGDNTLPQAVCTSNDVVISNPVLYQVSLDGVPPENLFLVDRENPEAGSTILNPPLSPAQAIRDYKLAANKRCVVYLSDQNFAGRFELYSVDIANPGLVARLNPGLSASKDVKQFVLSPDGTEVLYRADQDTDGVNELFLVNVNNPGISIKINSALVSNGDVADTGFAFSPDGSQILYAADQRVDGLFELFVVDKSTPGISQSVNPPFDSFVNLAGGSKYSPDGNWIGYMADQDVDDIRELYIVASTSLGTSTRINPDFEDFTDLCTFRFRPDSEALAYCADQDIDGILELYAVDISTPRQAIKINAPLITGGEVNSDFQFTLDSETIIYIADQDVAGQDELFSVELNAPGVSNKLNGPLIATGDVDLFRVRSDNSAVAYVADQEADTVFELYESQLDSPSEPVKMSNSPRVGTDLVPIEYTADGLSLIYLADQDTADRYELFQVQVVLPGESVRLNDSINAGGGVSSFRVPRE